MRINALSNTATDFASDDYIALDGETNGSRKMKNDKLLELTAQNALFKGSSSDLPNDLNDCSLNTIYNCTDAAIGSVVLNKPKSVNNFSVLTFGSSNSALVQFFVPANEQVQYYRSKWGANWTSWMPIESQILARKFTSSLSYSKGTRIFRNGNPYLAKEAVSAGSWDSSKWKDIFNKLALVITGSSSELPSDLNNCFVNTIYSCTNATIGASILHKPKAVNNFSVFTFGETEDTMFQIFAPALEKNFYFRSKWGANWTGWTLLPQVLNNILPVFSSLSTYTKGQRAFNGGSPYMAKQAVSAGSWDSSKWISVLGKTSPVVVGGTSDLPSDLNDCLINTIYTCTNSTTGASILHKPISEGSINQFTVITLGQENGIVQIYHEPYSKDIYIRCCWGGNWEGWKNIFGWESLQTEYFDINVLSAFSNIVCIGDSLTYSQVYTSDNTSRQAYRTYPQVLGKLCGSDSVESFAIGGITASQSWANYNVSVTSKTNALAIIYLGTNGGLTDTLATDADPNADPSTWSDTNTGCYAKWINLLQSLGYKILLIKISDGGGDSLATTNDVIGQIASRFGCAVVDAFKNTAYKYHYYPDLSGRNSVHYNDLGYAWFASALIEKVQKLPSDVLKYIIPA